MTPDLFLLVMLGGAVGAVVRFAAVHLTRRTRFPWAVLVMNAVGSFIAGLTVAAGGELSPEWTPIIVSGFCAGLTTYSTFAVDTVRLWQSGRGRSALGNAVSNLALGIGAAALGVAIGLTFI